MTVCDIRSDSFSITTSAAAWCEESAFVSTKQSSQSAEKKSDSDKKKEGWGARKQRIGNRGRGFFLSGQLNFFNFYDISEMTGHEG